MPIDLGRKYRCRKGFGCAPMIHSVYALFSLIC